ncbi:MAG: hypothetical protein Q4Q13_00770 [Vagococcus sp.]|nr:hypothetical protein [Vagococcus sp.]
MNVRLEEIIKTMDSPTKEGSPLSYLFRLTMPTECRFDDTRFETLNECMDFNLFLNSFQRLLKGVTNADGLEGAKQYFEVPATRLLLSAYGVRLDFLKMILEVLAQYDRNDVARILGKSCPPLMINGLQMLMQERERRTLLRAYFGVSHLTEDLFKDNNASDAYYQIPQIGMVGIGYKERRENGNDQKLGTLACTVSPQQVACVSLHSSVESEAGEMITEIYQEAWQNRLYRDLDALSKRAIGSAVNQFPPQPLNIDFFSGGQLSGSVVASCYLWEAVKATIELDFKKCIKMLDYLVALSDNPDIDSIEYVGSLKGRLFAADMLTELITLVRNSFVVVESEFLGIQSEGSRYNNLNIWDTEYKPEENGECNYELYSNAKDVIEFYEGLRTCNSLYGSLYFQSGKTRIGELVDALASFCNFSEREKETTKIGVLIRIHQLTIIFRLGNIEHSSRLSSYILQLCARNPASEYLLLILLTLVSKIEIWRAQEGRASVLQQAFLTNVVSKLSPQLRKQVIEEYKNLKYFCDTTRSFN